MRTRENALAIALIAVASTTQAFDNLEPAAINTDVVGTIRADTWDPEDPLTISGTLKIGENDCEATTTMANLDSIVLLVRTPDDPGTTGPGHKLCGSLPYRVVDAPGTNGSGNFAITSAGGGVSFLSGDGYTDWGGIMQLVFKDGPTDDWTVRCGTETRWPEVFGCDHAPDIYGVLASPDLNGDLDVDSGDTAWFASFLGDTITRSHAWQADFTHSGGQVDASDTGYYAGRLGVSCNSFKAGGLARGQSEYDMNVANLERPDVLELLELAEITVGDVLQVWDTEGWSYDEETAQGLLKLQRPTSVRPTGWGSVKVLYR